MVQRPPSPSTVPGRSTPSYGGFPPYIDRVMTYGTVLIVVLAVIAIGLISRDLVHRSENRHNALQHDLDALNLRSRIPAITGVSVTTRNRRPAITVIRFASGQSVTLNASYRWIYVELPWNQWDQAVALQREGNRRTRAGEGSGLTVQDDGSVGQPMGLPSSGPNAVVAWNPPHPDCQWCDEAALADGTTVSVSQDDRSVLVALPLSMLPEVLALPGHPSKAY